MKYYKPKQTNDWISPIVIQDTKVTAKNEIEGFSGCYSTEEKTYINTCFSWNMINISFLKENYTEVNRVEFDALAKDLLKSLYKY